MKKRDYIFISVMIVVTILNAFIFTMHNLKNYEQPYEECFTNCKKIKVVNGFSTGKYENNTCFCVFYVEKASIEYEKVKNVELIDFFESQAYWFERWTIKKD